VLGCIHLRLPSTAALVVLVALLSACGQDSDTGTTDDFDTSPLKVALFINASGPLPSGEENAEPVVRSWADAINDQGGVAGHPIEVVVADTKGDAPTATTAVRKLIKDETVVAAVMFDAATEGLVAAEITEAGLPVIGGMGYAPNAWGAMPNWLPLTTSIPSIFNMGIALGEHLGASNVAMTICAEIAGCEAAEPVVQSASEGLGLTYSGTYKISSSAPDYTAQCLQLIDAGTDYVMLGAATATAALRLASDCTEQNYEGLWGLFGGVIVPETMRASDPGVSLSLALNSFPWFAEDAAATDYRELMKAQGVPEGAWGDPHGTAAYATMELFRQTIDAAADELPAVPSRDDVISAYGKYVKDETLGGLLPQPVTFNADAPNALISCYWFGQFEGGVFADASLESPVCDSPAVVAAQSGS